MLQDQSDVCKLEIRRSRRSNPGSGTALLLDTTE